MNPYIPLTIFSLAVVYIIYKIFIGPKLRIAKTNKEYKELNQHKIENINKEGFELFIEGKPEHFKWREIKSLVLNEDVSITGELNNGGGIVISNNCINKVEFIKKVPKGIADFNYEWVSQFFKNLETCPVCGFKSLDQGDCLNCEYSIEYQTKHKGNSTKEDFFKEEQLDYFTVHFDVYEPVEKTLKKARESDLFEHDKNWKLYPIISEIKQAKHDDK